MASQESPERVVELAAQCVDDVRDALGIELDYRVETLPVVDHFCRSARNSSLWPDGAEQVAQVVGSYFGEVLRRQYQGDCRWHLSGEGLYAWRLEFRGCLLCFNPLGVALELLLEGPALGWNADFVTPPEVSEALQTYLERLGGVSEDDFFTLSVRSEVLETIHDFLLRWQRSRGEGEPSPTYDSEDYEELLARLEADAITAGFE